MSKKKGELLQGTLDMLILKTLTLGSMHGYAIVRRIQQATDEVLVIEEGSLYPALHRLEKRSFIKAKWGLSENNRKAKYYSLTPKGRKQLETEVSMWERLSAATIKVLSLSPEG